MSASLRESSLFTFTLNPDKVISSLNEAAIKYYKKSSEQLSGKDFLSLLPDNAVAIIDKLFDKTILFKESQHQSIADGKELWEWIIDPILSGENEIRELHVFVVHIINPLYEDSRKTKFFLELHNKSRILSERELYKYALDNAVAFTHSKVGYLHTVNQDQKSIELIMWNDEALKNCTSAVDKHYELDKAGIWADCARQKKPVIHNNYDKVQDKKGLPEGHFEVKRHMSLPVIDNGKVCLIIGVGNKDDEYTEEDITSLQLIANELQKMLIQKRNESSLRKISGAVEQSPLLIMILDLKGDVEYINPKFSNVTGYLSDEVVGKNVRELNYHDTAAQEYERICEMIFQGKDWNGMVQTRKKNGEMFWTWTSLFPIFGETGDVTNFMSIQEDITEQRRAEYETALLSESLKSVKDCVTITDLENNIIFVNQAFLETYGYGESEVIGKKISIVRRDKTIREDDRLITQTNLKDSWLGELTNIRKDGSEFPVEVWASTVRDKTGHPIALVGVARDITERKKIESDLIHAKENAEEANRLKTIFLANMSHELRTPMIGILGFSEILLELLTDNEELNGYANVIHNSGTRLLKTLNMLLDFSKVQSEHVDFNVKPINVVAVISDTANLFMEAAHKKNLYLTFMAKIESLQADYDERILRQVAENLINNAINYTDKGGVTVTVTKETVEGKAWLGLEVIDTGVGIPKEKQKLIWEPFRQASEGLNRTSEGTGLGLTLVKNFVAKVDGQIYLESEPGKGSRFYVLFPLKYG